MISKKDRCSGCGACAAVCHTGALVMRPNENNGFTYPVLREDLCVHCGQCDTICPEEYRPKVDRLVPQEAIACQHQDPTVRNQSASGGFFRALAQEVIAEGGTVYGAVHDSASSVCHRAAETLDELVPMSGSKYVQSELRDCFCRTDRLLREGHLVLFSGTMCQIAGLYNYLKRDDPNLVTITLVCHGNTSPLLLRSYVQYLETQLERKVHRINFRDKEYGWDCGSAVSCVDTEGKKHRLEGIWGSYLRGFVASPNYVKRSCCYACAWKGFPSIGDFLIGDYWDLPADTEIPFDRKQGVSLVLINSAKGEVFFQKIQEKLICLNRPFEEVNGGTLLHSVKEASNRQEFWRDCRTLPFDRLAKKYFLPRITLRRIASKMYRGMRKVLFGRNK